MMPTDLTPTGIGDSRELLANGSGAHLPKRRQRTSRKRGSLSLPRISSTPLPGTAALRPARQAGPQRSEEELDGQRYNRGGGQ